MKSLPRLALAVLVAAIDTLLASDFTFRFQQADIALGAPDSLTREQFLTAVGNLFIYGIDSLSQPASRILFSFTIQDAVEDNRIGHAGWLQYLVNSGGEVDFPDGDNYQISAPARYSYHSDGPGSRYWRLAEWQEVSSGMDAAGAPRHESPAEISPWTWGHLLFTYLNRGNRLP